MMDLSDKDLSLIPPRALSREDKHLKALLSGLLPGLTTHLVRIPKAANVRDAEEQQKPSTFGLPCTALKHHPQHKTRKVRHDHEATRPCLHALQAL